MKLMHSLELTDDEKLDALQPIAMPDRPDFPYGTRISLTEKEFDKMGVDENEAVVGATFHFWGMARITSVSKSDTPDGQCCRVEAQIEEMGMASEDVESKQNIEDD